MISLRLSGSRLGSGGGVLWDGNWCRPTFAIVWHYLFALRVFVSPAFPGPTPLSLYFLITEEKLNIINLDIYGLRFHFIIIYFISKRMK